MRIDSCQAGLHFPAAREELCACSGKAPVPELQVRKDSIYFLVLELNKISTQNLVDNKMF